MTRVAGEYAQALFSLAQDEKLDDRISKELQIVRETVSAEPTFLKILSAPNLPKAERCELVDHCFKDRVHPYVLNFIKVLTEKGYARQLPDCVSAYTELYHDAHGILPVKAVTSIELTSVQTEKLKSKLEKMTGKQVVLSNIVDPACMGGIRLDYDGKRVDDTVRHRLDDVRSLLINTAL